jgi:transcription elongation factor Elf1
LHQAGNQRAGIVTDCEHCRKSLRIAASSMKPGTKRQTFKCNVCGARWTKTGTQFKRV